MAQPDDRELAIRTIAAETSGDPNETLAIASIIRNRVATGKWGNTPGDVVLATNQFEPWNKPGGSNDPIRIDPRSPRYQLAAQAWDALESGRAKDPTGGRTHFFAPEAQAALGRNAPSWSRAEPGIRIGKTAFYAPEGFVKGQQPSMQIKWDDEAPSAPAGGAMPQGLMAFAPGPSPAAAAPLPPQRPASLGGSALPIQWDDSPAAAPAASPAPAAPQSPFGAIPDQIAQASPEAAATQAALDARKPGKIESLTRGIQQGVTANFSDELAGLQAASGIPELPGMAKVIGPNIGAGRLALEKIAPGIFGTSATEQYTRATQESRDANAAAQFQNPRTYLAGNLAGAVAIPIGGAASVGVRGGAAVGGAMGALTGAGEGETPEERLRRGAIGLGVGTVLGGVLGGVAGRLGAKAGEPAGGAVSGTVLPPANPVVQAAENLGVTVPKGVASESQIVQRATMAGRSTPFAGERTIEAIRSTQDQLGNVAGRVAADLGSGDVVTAGQKAGGAIRGWISGRSNELVRRAYDEVDAAVDNTMLTPLEATRGMVANILAGREASKLQGVGGAVQNVIKAVQQKEGLTYEGIKGLRTAIGEMLQKPNLLPAGTSQKELKRIYGALTDDLESAVSNSGGEAAVSLWQKANALNAKVMERRRELATIVGKDGGASDEQVFTRIQQLAASGSKGDIDLLMKARKSVGAKEWDEVSSAVIANLGRDALGNFSPDRFITAMSKISDRGKSVLFQPSHRAALNDISTISARMQEVARRYGNPSGTAQNVAWGALGAGVLTAPITTITSLIGANTMARVLSSPATASSMARWSRAYEMAVTKPSAATVGGLQVASRNFAATIGDKLGVQTSAQEILKLVQQGATKSAAEPGDQETALSPK